MTTPETKTVNTRRVVVLGRLAFVHLFKPAPKAKVPPGQTVAPEDLVYQTAILLPPTTNFEPLKKVMIATMIETFGKVVEITATNGHALRPCKGNWAGYAKGWFCINAKNEVKVHVVDGQKMPITSPNLVHAGQWANVALDCYGWNYGGHGLSFALKAVQIVRDGLDSDPDGARLDGKGSRVDPDEVFEALPMEEAGDAPPAGGDDAPWDPLAGLK